MAAPFWARMCTFQPSLLELVLHPFPLLCSLSNPPLLPLFFSFFSSISSFFPDSCPLVYFFYSFSPRLSLSCTVLFSFSISSSSLSFSSSHLPFFHFWVSFLVTPSSPFSTHSSPPLSSFFFLPHLSQSSSLPFPLIFLFPFLLFSPISFFLSAFHLFSSSRSLFLSHFFPLHSAFFLVSPFLLFSLPISPLSFTLSNCFSPFSSLFSSFPFPISPHSPSHLLFVLSSRFTFLIYFPLSPFFPLHALLLSFLSPLLSLPFLSPIESSLLSPFHSSLVSLFFSPLLFPPPSSPLCLLRCQVSSKASK